MNKRHAVVLVKNPNNSNEYLLGTRLDNGKVNFPAGGINENEEPIDGAKRELLEETGFKAKNIKLHSSYQEPKDDGSIVEVYVFISDIDGNPTLTKDPDREFQSIYWQDPFKVPSSNLQMPPDKNCGLRTLIKIKK